jgi:hypothetical protein
MLPRRNIPLAVKPTSAGSLMPSKVALLMAVLVFLGMVIETIVSLNGSMLAGYYLTNTGSVVLIPYWPWDLILVSRLWGLWTFPALLFLLWPLMWGLLVVSIINALDFGIPFYVQFGSVILDVLIIADAEFRSEFGVISVIPSYTLWVLIFSAFLSLLVYGLLLGAVYSFLFRSIILVTGLEERLNLKTYFVPSSRTGSNLWASRRICLHLLLVALAIVALGLWSFQPFRFETQNLITTLMSLLGAAGADLAGSQTVPFRRSGGRRD